MRLSTDGKLVLADTRDVLRISGGGGAPFDPLTVPNLEAFYEVSNGFHTTPGSAKNLIAWSENFRLWNHPITVTLTNEAAIGQGGVYPTATLLTPTGGVDSFVGQYGVPVAASIAKTFSFYAKRGPGHDGVSRAQIELFDLNQNIVIPFLPTASWARYSATITNTSPGTSAYCYMYPDIDAGTHSVYFDSAQLEYGSNPTAYEANGSTLNAPEVLQWLDQSGNGRHYVRITNNSPTYEASIFNGYTALKAPNFVKMEFTDGKIPITVATGQAVSYIGVVMPVGTGGRLQFEVWLGIADAGKIWRFVSGHQSGQFMARFLTSSGSETILLAPAAAGSRYVMYADGINGGAAHLYINGVLSASGTLPVFSDTGTPATELIGSENSDLCYLAASAWFSRVLTAQEIANFTNYFTPKYL